MFLVTANKPAKTNAERAEEMARDFPNEVLAKECAETWLRDGYVAVMVWQLYAKPISKQVIDWNDNG